MASRFWVGGTGTWDNSNTTNWSATSGGAGGQSAPVAGDDVTFDASSGGGVVTTNATLSIQSLTCSAHTGTLDFSANNNNITITGNFTNTGAGTRTFNMGNGTWTFSGGSVIFNQSGATNLTFNANSSTIAFTATTGGAMRRFTPGTRTYNILTIASSTAGTIIAGGGTIGTLTISPGNVIQCGNGTTITVTTMTNITGSASAQTLIISDSPLFGQGTISSANNWTGTWCSFGYMVFTGGGTFSATNSADLKNNSGITISAPSGSGGTTVVGVMGS